MEEFNDTTVWELLKVMQLKLRNNAKAIQKNADSVELIKRKYGRSFKREKIINSIQKNNLELTKENTSLLELHNSLYKFFKNFKEVIPGKANSSTSEDEFRVNWGEYRENCIKKTIQGKLKINQQHPFIQDDHFLSELMKRCTSLELYERCAEILKVKETVKIKAD